MEKHKVICPYCGAGCQFNLLVQNGQVVGTEPLNGITNQSELCLKGMSGYDFINDTKILTPRVLHPMIRRTKGADLERVSWNSYLIPLILLNTPEKFTLPVMIASLNASTDITANQGAIYLAVAISVIPILIVFAFCSKYIIGSISAGGVKE